MDDESIRLIEEIKQDQNHFQKAKKLQYLKESKKVRVKDLAEALDLKASYVCHILRLNKLPELVKDGYYSHTVSLSHLFIIARLKTDEQMLRAYEKVLSEALTAVQTEGLIREMLYDVETGGDYIADSEVFDLQNQLQELGIPCSLKLVQTRVRSRLMIEVKGGLKVTTPAIREVIQRMKG